MELLIETKTNYIVGARGRNETMQKMGWDHVIIIAIAISLLMVSNFIALSSAQEITEDIVFSQNYNFQSTIDEGNSFPNQKSDEFFDVGDNSYEIKDGFENSGRTEMDFYANALRDLLESNLSELNTFLSEVEIKLPDQIVDLNITCLEDPHVLLTNFLLKEIEMRRIQFNDNVVIIPDIADDKHVYLVRITGLALVATLDFIMDDLSVLENEGSVVIPVKDCKIDLQIAFKSTDFDLYPPSYAILDECIADINVAFVQIDGVFLVEQLNTIESLLRGFVENIIASTVCDISNDAVVGLSAILRASAPLIAPYLDINFEEDDVIPDDVPDDFFANLNDRNAIELVDFSNTNSSAGLILSLFVSQVDAFLAEEIEDPDNPYGWSKDIGINTLLRANVLDENQAFKIEQETLLFVASQAPVNMSLTLLEASIKGIDSFTHFNPLQAVSQALSSSFALPYIKVDVDLRVELNTGAVVAPESLHIAVQETYFDDMTFSIELTDIFFNSTVFVLLDLDKLENVPMGSFLNTSHLLPCSLASMQDFSLDQFDAALTVKPPKIDRFVDVRIGELLSSIMKATLVMSEKALENALPRFLGTTFRENVTALARSAIEDITACPTFYSKKPDAYLDFRDLLLEADDAREAGGSGDLPYGDVTPFGKRLINENFINPDDDGSPIVNNLIKNFTVAQSNTSGTIAISAETEVCGFNLTEGLWKFGFINAKIENLDTFDYPFDFMAPIGRSVLNNQMVIGTEDRPLKVGFRFTATIDGKEPKLNQYNDFYVRMEFTRLEILLVLVAIFYEEEMMQFPLISIADINCWLSKIPPIEELNEKTFGIEELSMKYEQLGFSFECLECSNQEGLPRLLEVVHNSGGIDLGVQLAFLFLKDFVYSESNQKALNDAIRDAPEKCPTHPRYKKEEGNDDSLPGLLGIIPIAQLTETSEENNSIELIEEDIPLRSCIPSGGNGFNIPDSRNGHEALIYAALFGVEVGLTMISLMIVNDDVRNTSDPLELQKLVSPQKLETLLDLSNLNETFLSFLSGPIEQGNATVSDIVEDPMNENFGDLGINNILKGMLDDDGVLSFPVNFAVDQTPVKANIVVVEARFMGLDSFKKMSLIKFIGPQTMQCEFEIETIDAEVTMSVTTNHPQILNKNVTENVTMAIGFNDIKFSAALFLAIKEQALKELKLGSLFKLSQLMPCAMQVVDNVNLTQLHLSVGKIKELKLEGFLSQDVKNTILQIHADIFKQYENDLLQAIPIASEGFFKPLANNALKDFTEGECELFEPEPDSYVDFRDLFLDPESAKIAGGQGTQPYGDVWATVYNLAQNQLTNLNEDGYPRINDVLIDSITDNGKIEFKDPILDTEFDLSERFRTEGLFTIRALYNSSVQNLDTIGNPLLLLYPETADLLNNSFVIGASDQPVRATTNAYIKLVDADKNVLENTFEFSISLTKLGLQALLKAKLKEKSFMQYPFEDIVNFNCWISAFPSRDLNEFGLADQNEEVYAGIDDIKIFLDQSTVEVKCLECESSELQYYAEMFTGVSFLYFTHSFIKSGLIQNMIDQAMYAAVRKCPHSPLYDPDFNTTDFIPFEAPDSGFSSAGTFLSLFAFFATLVMLTCCASQSVKHTTKRKYLEWLNTISHDEVASLYQKHMEEKKENTKLAQVTTSMLNSEEIPIWFRFIIPVIVVLNVGLFLSGHLNLGATINIHFFFAGQPFKIENLYTFAIIQLVSDMWRWANKAFAALVFVCSVVWPYSKQLITLILWVTPPTYISVKTRGKYYRILDFLAKWSMIDIFIIIIGLVCFRVKLRSTPNFPDGYFGGDMMMVPLWGLYANALAQIVSQLSSHVIIYYQDKITEKALHAIRNTDETTFHVEKSQERSSRKSIIMNEIDVTGTNEQLESISKQKRALCDHYFCLRGDKKGYKVMIHKNGNRFVAVTGILTIACIIYGCFARYLRVDMTGLIAGAISAGDDGEESVIKHSVVTVAGTVLEVGRFIGTIDKRIETTFLGILMVATCLLTPLLQCVGILYLWFMPLTMKEQKKLMTNIEIIMAWQYLEVYFLGTLVMLWQAKPISTGLMRIFCGQLESIFASLSQFGVLDEKDARCFLVNASLELSVIVHIAAAVLLDWITRFVLKAAEQRRMDNDHYHYRLSRDSETVNTTSSKELDHDDMVYEVKKPSPLFSDSYSWFVTKPIKSKISIKSYTNNNASPSSSITMIDYGIS